MSDLPLTTSIRISNFRALGDVELELKPLTAVVGPNGAGKSTLLHAIRLLASVRKGDSAFTEAFARYGGFRAALSYFGGDSATMGFGITTKLPKSTASEFEYDVKFSAEATGYFVVWEKMLTQRFGMERRLNREDTFGRWIWETISEKKSADFTMRHGPRLAVTEIAEVREEAASRFSWGERTFLYEGAKFQPNQRFRSPQQIQLSETPSNDGMDLLAVLYRMRTEQPDRYADFLDALRAAIPTLDELDFPPAGGAGYFYLRWKQRSFPRPFVADQLSDGILRFLWLVTILHSVPDDGLVMIDEPEISLHPEWIMLLVAILRKASARTTVLVATQSAELVHWLEPDELVIADTTEAGTTLTPARKKLDLDRWLKDFTLSELWTMGELGGRP